MALSSASTIHDVLVALKVPEGRRAVLTATLEREGFAEDIQTLRIASRDDLRALGFNMSECIKLCNQVTESKPGKKRKLEKAVEEVEGRLLKQMKVELSDYEKKYEKMYEKSLEELRVQMMLGAYQRCISVSHIAVANYIEKHELEYIELTKVRSLLPKPHTFPVSIAKTWTDFKYQYPLPTKPETAFQKILDDLMDHIVGKRDDPLHLKYIPSPSLKNSSVQKTPDGGFFPRLGSAHWNQLVVPFEVETDEASNLKEGEGQVVSYMCLMEQQQLGYRPGASFKNRFAVFTNIKQIKVYVLDWINYQMRFISSGILDFLPKTKPKLPTEGFELLFSMCHATPSELGYSRHMEENIEINGKVYEIQQILGIGVHTNVVRVTIEDTPYAVKVRSEGAGPSMLKEMRVLQQMEGCIYAPQVAESLCSENHLVTSPCGSRIQAPLTVVEAISAAICIVEALKVAAQAQICHNDLHLGNMIMVPPLPGVPVNRQYRVLVIDWGLACRPDESSGIIGVYAYAPTHILQDHNDRRTFWDDLESLAYLMYIFVEMKTPWIVAKGTVGHITLIERRNQIFSSKVRAPHLDLYHYVEELRQTTTEPKYDEIIEMLNSLLEEYTKA